MDKTILAQNLVDKIMDEGFENYSKIKTATRRVDLILDMLEECACRQDSGQENAYPCNSALDTSDKIADFELEPEVDFDNENKVVNQIPHTPNQDLAVQSKQLSMQIGENIVMEMEYKEFFKKMMERYNIKTIKELSDEEKQRFFNELKREWNNKKVLKRISS